MVNFNEKMGKSIKTIILSKVVTELSKQHRSGRSASFWWTSRAPVGMAGNEFA